MRTGSSFWTSKLLISVLALFLIQSSEFKFGSDSDHKFQGLKKNKVIVVKTGVNDFRLELAKNKHKSAELFLDFENKNSSDLKDLNGNYEINDSLYSVSEGKTMYGKRYASFTTRESQIRIRSNPTRLLSKTVISEPFYFSFFIMPGEVEQSSTIFSKTYITGAKKYGIECKVANSRTEFVFHNLFSYRKGETRSFTLSSSDRLKSKVWTHITITYDPQSGEGKLFEDGVEKSEFHAVLSSAEPTALLAGFHPNDTSYLVIGKGFYGKLDNFLIGRGELPDVSKMTQPYDKVDYNENIQFVNHTKGYAVSKVMKTENSKAVPLELVYKTNVPEGTHLEILYRFSEEPFSEEDKEPVWTHYDPETFKAGAEASPFQFFQWKAILRSDYSGKKTPSLTSLTLKYRKTVPPSQTFGLKLAKTDNSEMRVCFTWNSNHEENVKNGGGYLLHYGVSPEKMAGTIALDKFGSKINGLENGQTLQDKYTALSFCLDNDTILYNAERHKDRNMLLLKRGITYYVKISAYNSSFPIHSVFNGSKIGADQKSRLSSPVTFTFKSDTD